MYEWYQGMQSLELSYATGFEALSFEESCVLIFLGEDYLQLQRFLFALNYVSSYGMWFYTEMNWYSFLKYFVVGNDRGQVWYHNYYYLFITRPGQKILGFCARTRRINARNGQERLQKVSESTPFGAVHLLCHGDKAFRCHKNRWPLTLSHPKNHRWSPNFITWFFPPAAQNGGAKPKERWFLEPLQALLGILEH